jgi:competence protein ComEA
MKKNLLGCLILALVSASLLMPLVASAAPNHPTSTQVEVAYVSAKVNLNRATAAQLEKLPGVGPKIAAEIIKNRPYKNGKDLQKKVKGIGEKTWKVLEPLVTF